MSDGSLWNQWSERYDLFVSYAHDDNTKPEPKMVARLVDHICEDFNTTSPGDPLVPFFDTRSIPDGQFWEQEIRAGLRQSKLMIAILSDNYFASEWCRREWEEYSIIEQSRTYPGESLTPIFIVDSKALQKSIPAKARAWWDDIAARHGVVEVHPFWPKGLASLNDAVVRDRLKDLGRNLRDRVLHGRALAKVPRNMGPRNPNFVGRLDELKGLHALLFSDKAAGICAVDGVPGIGKSALAREYAYRFRRNYLGGQFEVDLSTVQSVDGVKSLIVQLARGKLKANIPETLPEPEQFRRAREAFENLPAAEPALLILDNLNEWSTDLVGAAARKEYPSGERVHLLVTTRAAAGQLGTIKALPLDVLSPADALDVLFRYRQFGRNLADPQYLAARDGTYELTAEPLDVPADAEWKFALAIVGRLGRHALAVALVGAYLGCYPNVTYAKFEQGMRTHGIGLALKLAGNETAVKNLFENPEILIGKLFEQSLVHLTPLAVRILEYAAFLPPDLIPMTWLEKLIATDAEMTPHLTTNFVGSRSYDEATRTLAGLQYLVGELNARMHRVLQDVIRRRMEQPLAEIRERTMLRFVRDLVFENYVDVRRYSDGELKAVEQLIRSRSDTSDEIVGQSANYIIDHLQSRGRLTAAHEIATIARRIFGAASKADPDSKSKLRELSVAYNKLGDVAVTQGRLDAAAGYYGDGLTITKRLAEFDPANAGWQRDLSISYNNLGNVAVAQGRLEAAAGYYGDGLTIRKRLADSDPANADWQRDLSISYNKLGDVAVAQGRLDAAAGYYADYLAIAKRLAESDPANVGWQRDLSISYNKLGDMAVAQGRLDAAAGYYGDGLTIAKRLAESDPANAGWQRDLSVSYNKLGDVAVAQGRLEVAASYYADYLAIAQRLADSDPANAGWQRDLSVSYNKLGDVAAAQGRLEAAADYYGDDLAITKRLAESDPANAGWQRDLSISYNKLGNVAVAQGRLDAAAGYYADDLSITKRLAEFDPANAGWQRDLSVSYNKLGDVAVAQGRLELAAGYYDDGLTIRERLAESDPANAGWQRDLWVSHYKLADLAAKQNQPLERRRHIVAAIEIIEQMDRAGLFVSDADRGFLDRLRGWLASE